MNRQFITTALLGAWTLIGPVQGAPAKKPIWGASFNFEPGIASYSLRGLSGLNGYDYRTNLSSPALRLSFFQTLSFHNFIFLELRESLSRSFGAFETRNQYYQLDSVSYFFDGDISLYPSICAGESLKFQPTVGGAIHRLYEQYLDESGVHHAFNNIRFIAPFVGLYFAFDPTPASHIRAGTAYHFPMGKYNSLQGINYNQMTSVPLKGERHGLSAKMDFSLRLNQLVEISGSLDYFAYWALSGLGPNISAKAYLLNATSFTFGAKLNF